MCSDSDDNEEEFVSKVKDNTQPILYEKVKHYVKNGCQNQKSFLEQLAISPREAYEIEHLTKTQSQCELWKVHRKGLVISTKLYDVFTRQATIERNSSKSGSSLARKIVDGGDSSRSYTVRFCQLRFVKSCVASDLLNRKPFLHGQILSNHDQILSNIE